MGAKSYAILSRTCTGRGVIIGGLALMPMLHVSVVLRPYTNQALRRRTVIVVRRHLMMRRRPCTNQALRRWITRLRAPGHLRARRRSFRHVARRHVIARVYAMRHQVRLLGMARPLLWVNVIPLRRRQIER